MSISQTKGCLEKHLYCLLEEPMLFLLALKLNLLEKVLSSVETKTKPNLVVKLAGMSNHSFLLSI